MLNGFGEAASIEKLRSDLAQEFGVKCLYNGADMSKPAEIVNLVAETEKKLGRLDILVNNAGIQYVSKLEDFPVDKWDAVIAINLSSSFHTIRSAVTGMKRRKFGRIINIASSHGLVASANKSAYVTAKHGLIGLTKATAMETANDGITCNAICPGWVMTPLVEQQIISRAAASGRTFDEEKLLLVSEKQPMHQFTTPENIGSLAVFLASNAASTGPPNDRENLIV
jgi:3-hydroxybutyrate dehydrogenase